MQVTRMEEKEEIDNNNNNNMNSSMVNDNKDSKIKFRICNYARPDPTNIPIRERASTHKYISSIYLIYIFLSNRYISTSRLRDT